MACGPNLSVRWPRNRARMVEFYWSSSLELPLKRHVYLVSRNISTEPTPSSLKTAALPPWPNPNACLPPLPSKSQPEFNPDIAQRKKTRANRALEASPGEAESNRSRSQRRDGDSPPVSPRRLARPQFGRLARRSGQNYRSLQGE